MSKKVITIFFLANYLLAASPVLAVDIGVGRDGTAEQIAGRAGYDINVTGTTLSETVGKIIFIVLSFVGTIFFALTIYAGVLWMTAQGNEEQVGKALGILKTATIGLIITVAGYGITYYVIAVSTQVTRLQ